VRTTAKWPTTETTQHTNTNNKVQLNTTHMKQNTNKIKNEHK